MSRRETKTDNTDEAFYDCNTECPIVPCTTVLKYDCTTARVVPLYMVLFFLYCLCNLVFIQLNL